MTVLSVHSHKGGVGKSTFVLFFARYLAQVKKQKTCLIDLDFHAQGLRSTYLRKYLTYDCFDLLLADEDKKPDIIDRMPVKHEEIDGLYFIANFFKPQMDIQDQGANKRKMFLKLASEVFTGEITDNLDLLIRYLEKKGFQWVIIDCHPGLVMLSDEVIKRIKAHPVFVTTANIISFIGLFQNILARMKDWQLELSGLNIIINRVPDNFDLEKALHRFLDSRDAADDEKLVCSEIMKKLINQKDFELMVVRENEKIRDMDSLINPRTLLSMDLPADLEGAVKRLSQRLL
jgi:cellulose biosynthesis protein BcsQ